MSTVYRAILLLVLVSAMILFWWLVVPEDETPAEPGWLVTYVTDGDTFDVARGSVTETVRVIGIDTPERDECGYDEATEFLESIILTKP